MKLGTFVTSLKDKGIVKEQCKPVCIICSTKVITVSFMFQNLEISKCLHINFILFQITIITSSENHAAKLSEVPPKVHLPNPS